MGRSKNKCKFGDSKADIRIISSGKSIGEAIENSFPCFSSYVFDRERVKLLNEWRKERFCIERGELEDTIHDVYSEIIYLIYVKEFVISRIFVEFGRNINVIAEATKVNDFPRYIRGEIKAITYHNLKVTIAKNVVTLDITFDV